MGIGEIESKQTYWNIDWPSIGFPKTGKTYGVLFLMEAVALGGGVPAHLWGYDFRVFAMPDISPEGIKPTKP